MKQSTTSTHPLRIPLFTLLLVTYFCASTGLHVAYAAATQGAAGYHDAKTFDSKIIADFTRFQPVFFGPLNSTFLCNSTHLAKNLPRCNGNFWNGDEIGRFTCDSDKKTVLSTMPTRCCKLEVM